jgi:hypothetical protein
MDQLFKKGLYDTAFIPATNVTAYKIDQCENDVYWSNIVMLPTGSNDLCIYEFVLTILWPEEITFSVSVFLLGVSLFMLQQFIQAYAYNLIDRQNHVTRLSKQNEDLKTQLKAYV